MGVIIGKRTVEGATVAFQGASLRVDFPSENTFAQLEKMYADAATIEIDSGTAAELYYSKGLVGMAKKDGKASLTFAVTTIGPDVADELRDGIDGSDNAILDLAALVCVHDEQIAELWAAVFPEDKEEE